MASLAPHHDAQAWGRVQGDPLLALKPSTLEALKVRLFATVCAEDATKRAGAANRGAAPSTTTQAGATAVPIEVAEALEGDRGALAPGTEAYEHRVLKALNETASSPLMVARRRIAAVAAVGGDAQSSDVTARLTGGPSQPNVNAGVVDIGTRLEHMSRTTFVSVLAEFLFELCAAERPMLMRREGRLDVGGFDEQADMSLTGRSVFRDVQRDERRMKRMFAQRGGASRSPVQHEANDDSASDDDELRSTASNAEASPSRRCEAALSAFPFLRQCPPLRSELETIDQYVSGTAARATLTLLSPVSPTKAADAAARAQAKAEEELLQRPRAQLVTEFDHGDGYDVWPTLQHLATSASTWRASRLYTRCHDVASQVFAMADIDDVGVASWAAFTDVLVERFTATDALRDTATAHPDASDDDLGTSSRLVALQGADDGGDADKKTETSSADGKEKATKAPVATSSAYEIGTSPVVPPDTRGALALPGYPQLVAFAAKQHVTLASGATFDAIVSLAAPSVTACCPLDISADVMQSVHVAEQAITNAAREAAAQARRKHATRTTFQGSGRIARQRQQQQQNAEDDANIAAALAAASQVSQRHLEWIGPPPSKAQTQQFPPVIVTSSGDLFLRFYRVSLADAQRQSVVPPFRSHRCHATPTALTTTRDRVLLGDGTGKLLVLDGNTLIRPEIRYEDAVMGSCVAHTRAITGIAMVPALNGIVTSALDGQLMLLDEVTLQVQRSFQAHETGIIILRYSAAHNIFVTQGFERSTSLWVGLGKGQSIALFDGKMPHMASVVSVEIVDDLNQVVTIDAAGLMKVWDATTYRCVNTVSLDTRGREHQHKGKHRDDDEDDFTNEGAADAAASGRSGDVTTKRQKKAGTTMTTGRSAHAARLGIGSMAAVMALVANMTQDLSVACVQQAAYCAAVHRVVAVGHKHTAVATYFTTQQLVRAHLTSVVGVAVSPLASLIATCSPNEVRLWDLERGALRVTIPLPADHATTFTCIASDATGAKVFCGTADGHVIAFRASSGRALKAFMLGAPTNLVVPPGTEASVVAALTAAHGSSSSRTYSVGVRFVGYEDDSRILSALGTDNVLRIFRDAGESRAVLRCLVLDARRSVQNAAAFSFSTRLFASSNATGDVTVTATDSVTGKLVHELDHADDVTALCFLGTLPAVAVGDVRGIISIVPVRAGLHHHNVTTAHTPKRLHAINHWSVPTHLAFSDAQQTLYVGDGAGCVAAYNVAGLLFGFAACGLRPVGTLIKYDGAGSALASLPAVACAKFCEQHGAPDDALNAEHGTGPMRRRASMTDISATAKVQAPQHRLVGIVPDRFHTSPGAARSGAGQTRYGAVSGLTVLDWPTPHVQMPEPKATPAAPAAAARSLGSASIVGVGFGASDPHDASSASAVAGTEQRTVVVVTYTSGSVVLLGPDLADAQVELVDSFPPYTPVRAAAQHRSSTEVPRGTPAHVPDAELATLCGDVAIASVRTSRSATAKHCVARINDYYRALAHDFLLMVRTPKARKAAGLAGTSLLGVTNLSTAVPSGLGARRKSASNVFMLTESNHGPPERSRSRASSTHAEKNELLSFYDYWLAPSAERTVHRRALRLHRHSATTRSREWWAKHRKQQHAADAAATAHDPMSATQHLVSVLRRGSGLDWDGLASGLMTRRTSFASTIGGGASRTEPPLALGLDSVGTEHLRSGGESVSDPPSLHPVSSHLSAGGSSFRAFASTRDDRPTVVFDDVPQVAPADAPRPGGGTRPAAAKPHAEAVTFDDIPVVQIHETLDAAPTDNDVTDADATSGRSGTGTPAVAVQQAPSPRRPSFVPRGGHATTRRYRKDTAGTRPTDAEGPRGDASVRSDGAPTAAAVVPLASTQSSAVSRRSASIFAGHGSAPRLFEQADPSRPRERARFFEDVKKTTVNIMTAAEDGETDGASSPSLPASPRSTGLSFHRAASLAVAASQAANRTASPTPPPGGASVSSSTAAAATSSGKPRRPARLRSQSVAMQLQASVDLRQRISDISKRAAQAAKHPVDMALAHVEVPRAPSAMSSDEEDAYVPPPIPRPPKPKAPMPHGSSARGAQPRLFDHPQLYSADPVPAPPEEFPFRAVDSAGATGSVAAGERTSAFVGDLSRSLSPQQRGEGGGSPSGGNSAHDGSESESDASDVDVAAVLGLAQASGSGVSPTRRRSPHGRHRSPPHNRSPMRGGGGGHPRVEKTATHRRLVEQWQRSTYGATGGGDGKPLLSAQQQRSARLDGVDMVRSARLYKAHREV